MRADARRNYDRLLEQAKVAFAESGVDASLDDIARQAGVASGTLYRHFPTRLDLIEAVLTDQIADLVNLGHQLLASKDTFDALAAWLHAALRHGLTYRGLSAVVMNSALDREKSMVSTWHAQMFDVGATLLAQARESATIAADTNDADILKMIGAIAWAAQDAPEGSALAERLLALLLNGLRHDRNSHD